MRFHLVITELSVGGAEKCLTDIACYVKARGHDVRVVSLSPAPDPERSALVDRLFSSGVGIDFLNASGKTDWFSVKRQLKQIATSHRPDVALSFLFHANLASSAIYPKLNVPWLAGVRVADRSRWRAFVSRRIYRAATRVVCVSKTVANHVKEFEGCDEAKLSVISNGIDLSRLLDASYDSLVSNELGKMLGPKPYALFIGRYAAQKQIPWLIELVRQVHSSKEELRVVTIGDGPMKPLIEQAAKKYPDRIINRGWLSEVFPLIKGSQMLLLPSAYEGMPNVVLEAMACGKPVAATDVEGVVELLGPNAIEQVSPAGNLKAWINRVKRLRDDEQLRTELGSANLIRCKQEFDLASKMQAYEQLLTDVAR